MDPRDLSEPKLNSAPPVKVMEDPLPRSSTPSYDSRSRSNSVVQVWEPTPFIPLYAPESEKSKTPVNLNDFVFPSLEASLESIPTVLEDSPTAIAVVRKISTFIAGELHKWKETHQRDLQELQKHQEKLGTKAQKAEKEFNKLNERNTILSKRIELMRTENETLRDTILKLQDILSNGPDASSTAELNTIKEKLWEGTLQINQQKTQHINLLKRLVATRFNPSNDKHTALLTKYLQLHGIPILDTPRSQWHSLGFDGELESSILSLQNLVYFSERYNQLAKKMNNDPAIAFPQVGIKTTAMLASILYLQSGTSEILPANNICKSFVRLMDHPKAFEELYCVSLRLYNNAISSGDSEPLKTAERKIVELLVSNPGDLQTLIQNAEKL